MNSVKFLTTRKRKTLLEALKKRLDFFLLRLGDLVIFNFKVIKIVRNHRWQAAVARPFETLDGFGGEGENIIEKLKDG